jgi:hypothetical protein
MNLGIKLDTSYTAKTEEKYLQCSLHVPGNFQEKYQNRQCYAMLKCQKARSTKENG